MADKDGNKTGGRKKGSQNKDSGLKDWVRELLSDNKERMQDEISLLKGKSYTDTYLSLMEYAVPKLQRVELDADIDVKAEGFTINYIKPEKK
tara:strand:+ start:99 stop:374 length:276 start_codon:yes stop_codon:yes gene_type:complete